MDKIEKLMIVGSGPAGLAAAIYASRGGLEPLVITGDMPGGLPTLATDVEDYPGFPQAVKGSELIGLFKTQAEKFGARFIGGKVISVNFKTRPFEVKTERIKVLSQAVILALGSSPIWLGLPSEQKLIGRGVSICATCDGPFFKDKKVAVVGGGDNACKEAYYLSKMAKEVTIIHRRNIFRAQQALQEQIKSRPNIKILFNSQVEEVLGKDKVMGLKIKDTQNGQISQLQVDGVFIAIGHKPATDFLKSQIELDEKGFIVIKENTQTSVPGVFAAGDVADPIYRQIITAAAAGCKAALDAEKYLDSLK